MTHLQKSSHQPDINPTCHHKLSPPFDLLNQQREQESNMEIGIPTYLEHFAYL